MLNWNDPQSFSIKEPLRPVEYKLAGTIVGVVRGGGIGRQVPKVHLPGIPTRKKLHVPVIENTIVALLVACQSAKERGRTRQMIERVTIIAVSDLEPRP